MSPEVFHSSNSPREEKLQEPVDPEKKLTPQDLKDMREKIAGRLEMPLPQYLRGCRDLFQKRQYAICERINATMQFSPSQLETYEQLTHVLQRIEGAAGRIEQEAEKEQREMEWFTATMSLLREAEKLIALLEEGIQKTDPSWLSYEQEQRAAWMQSMLSYGLPTELLHEGKHRQIQTLAVPDNVTVTTVQGVDFQEVATGQEYQGEKATAFGPYARKIMQFRKLIHLKIPEGETPVLKFEWNDAQGNKVESTVTGERRENGTWIFRPETPQEPVQERTWGRRRFR